MKFAQVADHINAGRYEQAKALLQRVLQLSPADPTANNGMSIVLNNLGQSEGALMYAQRAAAGAPGDANILNTLGTALNALGRQDEAIKALDKALSIEPANPYARITMCNALWSLKRFSEATAVLRKGLELVPNHPELTGRITPQLVLLGRADEGIALCKAALAAHPGALEPAIKLCSSIVYASHASVREIGETHRAYGRALAAQHATPVRAFSNSKEPDRLLRVAFLSADLRHHSVAFFVESLIQHLDRTQFSITCYANTRQLDHVSDRIKAACSTWRVVEGMRDADLVARILADKIDILIDLHGVSVGHRLPVFQMRPAPVQVTYCGYPATTGLSTMDYRIVDSITDPPGADEHCTEKLVRLDPCFLCYRPPQDAPPPAPQPPSVSAGDITFGSFNTSAKLNDRTCALWSRVLLAVPGSRLVLKAHQFSDAPFCDELRALFVRHGLDAARVAFLPSEVSPADHLRAYERLDLALDPVPYNGTTTTCEALWMGVPVVTVPGDMHASRVGASLLTQVGLRELIAEDEDDYVRVAAALANDPARLASLRTGLRERMQGSPLCDAPAHAARFAAALRSMWTSWCAGAQVGA